MKCRECRECNGIACRGEIPGVGGKDTGNSFIRNVEALKKVKLKMDVLCVNKPITTETTILGNKLPLPMFVAPIAGIKGNYGADISEYEYNQMVLEASEKAGILSFTGDGIDVENLFQRPAQAIHDHNGRGIVTIKPWVKEGIDERLAILKNMNYQMIAMDVDAAGLPLLRAGKTPVENKSVEALRYVKEKCGKPFIVKGIMSVEAALKALEAGADGIVVSNHGGRVCDETLGTIEVLEDIVAAVKGQMIVLIDGGIRSGNDIFKCLALGADGVLIGRPCALSVVKDGAKGLEELIQKYQNQLAQAMLMTGCHRISDITKEKVIVL